MEYLSLLYLGLPILLFILVYVAREYINNFYIQFVVSLVVQQVEQLKKDGKLEDKKREAIRLIQKMLSEVKINLPDYLIEEFIEKWVWDLYNQFQPEKAK